MRLENAGSEIGDGPHHTDACKWVGLPFSAVIGLFGPSFSVSLCIFQVAYCIFPELFHGPSFPYSSFKFTGRIVYSHCGRLAIRLTRLHSAALGPNDRRPKNNNYKNEYTVVNKFSGKLVKLVPPDVIF